MAKFFQKLGVRKFFDPQNHTRTNTKMMRRRGRYGQLSRKLGAKLVPKLSPNKGFGQHSLNIRPKIPDGVTRSH